MFPEQTYKSYRSALIDGIFVGVALAIVGKYAAKKALQAVQKDEENSPA